MKLITIHERIKKIIVAQLGVRSSEINGTTDVKSDLGADSLDVVEIFILSEDEFNIEISDDDFNNIRTVGNLVDYVFNTLISEGNND